MKAVTPKKKLGQHFLNDLNIAKKIADQLLVQDCKNILERRLRVTTHNVRGMRSAGKRETMEIWATKNNIDILLIQETKTN